MICDTRCILQNDFIFMHFSIPLNKFMYSVIFFQEMLFFLVFSLSSADFFFSLYSSFTKKDLKSYLTRRKLLERCCCQLNHVVLSGKKKTKLKLIKKNRQIQKHKVNQNIEKKTYECQNGFLAAGSRGLRFLFWDFWLGRNKN